MIPCLKVVESTPYFVPKSEIKEFYNRRTGEFKKLKTNKNRVKTRVFS